MAARRKKRWKTILPTATLTAIPFFVNPSVATAFFPPVVTTAPIVVPPAVPPLIVVPPGPPPPFVPPPPPPPIALPPPPPPPGPCCCVSPPPPPCSVPEPASIVTGLFGLVTAAGYGVYRRKRDGTADPVEGVE